LCKAKNWYHKKITFLTERTFMIRNAGYAKIYTILVTTFITSTVMHGMHVITRARVAKISHHVPTKKVARHAHRPPCSPNAYKCCELSLLHRDLSPDIFRMELNACCSRTKMARSLTPDLIERGEYEKIATVLKIPLFSDAELDACKNFAQTLLTNKQDIKYVHTIALLTTHKHLSNAYDGGYSKIISDDKSTKTHGENSSCCCDWE
jgi:hypothetical protein